ncbi:MAG TPA: TadE/TadG family type IV pilus assembly protein, partial [Pirellulales bacterium]
MRLRQGDHRCQRRGTAVVETAFVLPVVLMFFFGIFEYGKFLSAQQAIENAARAGARFAVVNTSTATTQQIQNVVTGRLSTVNSWINPVVTIYRVDPTTGNNLGAWTNATFGQSIAVQVTGSYTPQFAS